MTARRAAWLALGALYLLHNDLWWWHAPVLWIGLPASLVYHVLFGLAVTVALWPLAGRLLAEPPSPGR